MSENQDFRTTADGVSLASGQERGYWPGPRHLCSLCDAHIPHRPADCGKYAGMTS